MTTTISSLIEFLMALLGDDDLQADFRADPDGVLNQYGLDGTCGEDIRDAGPMLADQVGVHSVGHGHFAGGDDPVREITVLTRNYDVTHGPAANTYNYYYVDDNDLIITVYDNDTISIQADGDLTITDSFNEDNDVTVVQDSFNQDNDGVDNKGGTIDDSVVAGHDQTGSLNSDDDVTTTGSHNDTVSGSFDDTDTDLSGHTTVDGSFSGNVSDDDFIDTHVDVADGPDGTEPADEQAPLAVHDPADPWPVVDADPGGELDASASVSG